MTRLKGDSIVTWTNYDQAPHTVTAENGRFDSGVPGTGATYRRVFGQPGTYAYRCTLHPAMRGTVEVAP